MKTTLPLLLALILGICLPCEAITPAQMADYWIAKATPDPLADGTKENPFTVLTAADMTTVLASIPNDSHIHFYAGTYSWTTMQLKPGWWISGAGMDKTILVSDGAVTDGPMMYTLGSSSEVRDLTLDGNRSSSHIVAGVAIYGDRGIVERVRVTNTGGPYSEAFPILLATAYSSNNPCSFIVRDCLVDNTESPGGGTAIIVARNGAPGATVNGTPLDYALVEGNVVIGGGCLGIAGLSNATFRSNYVNNTGKEFGGFNYDTCTAENLTIEGNTFIGSLYPYGPYGVINIASAGLKFSRIKDNYIYITPNGYTTSGIATSGTVSDLEISENVILHEPWGGPGEEPNNYYNRFRGISASTNSRLRIRNNIIQCLSNDVTAAQIQSALGNRNLTGAAIASLPDKNDLIKFSAYASSTQAVAASTNVTLNFASEEYDSANTFSGTTFTPGVAGNFILRFSVKSNLNYNVVASIGIYRNGTLYKSVTSNDETINGNVMVVSTSATDYFHLVINKPGGTAITVASGSAYTFFSGEQVP